MKPNFNTSESGEPATTDEKVSRRNALSQTHGPMDEDNFDVGWFRRNNNVLNGGKLPRAKTMGVSSEGRPIRVMLEMHASHGIPDSPMFSIDHHPHTRGLRHG